MSTAASQPTSGFYCIPWRVSCLGLSLRAEKCYGVLLARSDAPPAHQPCDRPICCDASTEELLALLRCGERTLGLCLRELEQARCLLTQGRPGPRGSIHLLIDRMGGDVPAPSGAIPCASNPEGTCATSRRNLRDSGRKSRNSLRPLLLESSKQRKEESPPNPPMGGKPEGGISSSTPGKAEDPRTGARSSDSRPSGQSAQQTPPVPPAPPVAARIKSEARDEAEAGGLPVGAASKLARKAEAAAIAGEPEADIVEAVEAAVARWGQGECGASSLVAVTLDRFDETIDRARRRRRANAPDATWEEIPKDRQASFSESARSIFGDIYSHRAPDDGAAAAEFHAQAGRDYREVGVTGRAVREFQRVTGYANPHCGAFFSLPDELDYRAMLGFAWAEWHLGRGERDKAAEKLRAMGEAIRAHGDRVEKEYRERDAAQKAKNAEERAAKEAERKAQEAFSQTQRDAAQHVFEAYEQAGGKDRMGKVNAKHLAYLARTPEDVERVLRLAELPPDQLVEIIDGIGRGPGGRTFDQMLAPPPPPPTPPAPPTPLERARANAERLVDFRHSGVVPNLIPQAATA